MISRYTALIPAYIWTEEMARFLFIWMIMIGAMIGVREAPTSRSTCGPAAPRGEAAVRIVARLGIRRVRARVPDRRHRVHELRLVPHLRAGRPAALDDPHRLAVAGSPGSSSWASSSRRSPNPPGQERDMTGALFSAGEAASILFGCFFVLLALRVPVAFALGLACLPLFYRAAARRR
jgi:hypothetical protein